MRLAASWSIGAFLGLGWGVLFVSWMLLPMSVPGRIVLTVVIVALLAVAGPTGRAAAGGFALATGAVASLILAASGLVLGDAPLAPLALVVVGAALTWLARVQAAPAAGPDRADGG